MDVENWSLEILDAMIHKIPFARRLYYLLTSAASALSAMGTIYEWFGIPRQAYGLLTATIVGLSGVTMFVLAIGGLRLKKYRRLIETFDEVTSLHKGSYSIENVTRRYVIEKNGDTFCTREAEVRSIGETLRCEQIMFGATPEGPPVRNFEKLQFSVTAMHSRIPMKNIVLSDDERRKRVVVIFSPPAKPDKCVGYTISYRWPGLWKPLLQNGTDHGFVNVKTRTKHMVLELKVPDGVYIEHFAVSPEAGVVEISGAKSSIIWTVDNPEEGQYRYEIYCSKMPAADVATD